MWCVFSNQPNPPTSDKKIYNTLDVVTTLQNDRLPSLTDVSKDTPREIITLIENCWRIADGILSITFDQIHTSINKEYNNIKK